MISIEHLSKSFGDLPVLKDISLQIQPGETVVLIGPSGSGKSTLLRCLNGLETPDGGTIKIGSTAMVFQSYALFANKTALGNISLPLILNKKMPKSLAQDTARGLLEQVGLKGREHSYPSQLSGGQQQRVGIARAIALNPDVLLFDEPTSALDPEWVQGILDLILDLCKDKTAVIVTHEMEFARKAADRVIFMDQGKIAASGTPDELFGQCENPRLKEFLGAFRSRTSQ